MLGFLKKIHGVWRNSVLLAVYHVLDTYACSEKVRTAVTRTILWTSITVISLLLYFALTRWIPASRTLLDFTKQDTKSPAAETPPQIDVQPQPAGPIPVEKDITY